MPKENIVGRENGAAEIFFQMMIPERKKFATETAWKVVDKINNIFKDI